MNTPSKNAGSVELLAPAGDWDCVAAAVENGADAIYFGLDCGFNARYRAKNFGIADLPKLGEHLRRRGVRGYVTMNTLVFPSEMEPLVDVIAAIAQSGIDAVLVQDFGVARMVRTICPELEIHASTQMSLTSAETIAVARQLDLARVVLARELSVDEIRKIAAETDMPLEVFIHGALCVAYSGQCLTSESLGGRSANRGQCAQACRLPYELVCDGEDRPLGDVRYLLSPQDLAGYEAIPDLVDAGVASIKIEGRLKTPEYVANITKHYRAAIDQVLGHTGQNVRVELGDQARQEMELSFSRGFSPGWLEGNDHKRLVPGLNSAKRGVELGRITDVFGETIELTTGCDIRLGDGVAIETQRFDDPTDPQEAQRGWQGGRIYGLSDPRGRSLKSAPAGSLVRIEFGRDDLDWDKIAIDQTVFKNDDPALNRKLRHSYEQKQPRYRRALDLKVIAKVGERLEVTAVFHRGEGLQAITVSAEGDEPLVAAHKRPITEAVLREKLGRLGGTPFQLGNLELVLSGQPMVPMAMLNETRRKLVDRLEMQLRSPAARQVEPDAGRKLLQRIREVGTEPTPGDRGSSAHSTPKLAVLCRTMEQLDTACDSGADEVYVDFHDIRQYGDAVKLARRASVPIAIAGVRMQKPGEMGLMKVLLRHQPDAILARNLAAIEFFGGASPTDLPARVIADFSLNVANHRSAEWLMGLGVERLTASYDLNRNQLFDLVEAIPSEWIEVVIHQHMPMFHMEHCVFCSVMSPGTNKTNCGRPCDDHVVQLRDRVGAEHPLHADVACRNTLYNATPQSGSEIVSELIDAQVDRYRIELLEEQGPQARSTIHLYQRLLRGEIDGRDVWQQLHASNRLGVTRGTLEAKRDPLSIL